MELRQLRYFLGVSQAGSLMKASHILHIAQPALSLHMAALEAELGTVLFMRSSRGMSLTESGRTLVEYARVVMADVERAKSAVQNVTTELSGEVVIGLPTTVALVATLPIIEASRLRHPKIFLRLVESHSGYLKEWLQAGRLDLSVLFASAQESWLSQTPLLKEKLCVVGPPRKGNRGMATSTELKKIADLPMMLPGKDHGLRRILDEACAQQNVKLNVLVEIDSLPNIKKAVSAGLAYTVLSPGAVAEEVAAGKLEQSTLVRPNISRTIVCATSLIRPLTPAASAMVELINETLRELVRSGRWPGTLEKV